ncbi:hypothetical protein KQX54_015456 [Cotesia glomerata]|uniref:Uncharacterized protein n=1 Tax=Cotesia glomerata TaxID=32391 RepID=A0AAV7IHY4_COTGL|nr:hypothetical protein KQX54_015456 [Cotesia glomerata]
MIVLLECDVIYPSQCVREYPQNDTLSKIGNADDGTNRLDLSSSSLPPCTCLLRVLTRVKFRTRLLCETLFYKAPDTDMATISCKLSHYIVLSQLHSLGLNPAKLGSNL